VGADCVKPGGTAGELFSCPCKVMQWQEFFVCALAVGNKRYESKTGGNEEEQTR